MDDSEIVPDRGAPVGGAADGAEERKGTRNEAPARESEERESARRRGQMGAEAGGVNPQQSHNGQTVYPSRGMALPMFQALADNVRDYAIFLANPDGIITYWGEGARLMKWWTPQEAEGAHLRFLYPDGGSEDGTAEAHLQAAAEHGEYTGEGHRVRSDGSTFWAGISLTALRDPNGKLMGFAKVARDLTARHAAEAALKAATGAAETLRAEQEANRSKAQFLSTLSHEIRTPTCWRLTSQAPLLKCSVLALNASGPAASTC